MTENVPAARYVASPLSGVADLAGKYMTFHLADEIYGIGLLDVREIIELMEITRVPQAPEFIRGVINLRGRVIPVADLRVQLGMGACSATDQTVIIVVQCQHSGRHLTMGLLVDQVLEVLDLEADQIEPVPEYGATGARSFIVGLGKAGQKIVLLLGIASVLSEAEAEAVERGVSPDCAA